LTRRGVCVKMSNMKSASVREVQHQFARVLAWVARGEEVHVYRRKQLVAKLVPPGPAAIESPDFVGRARRVWGKRPRGKSLSQLASEARGTR
jgi:antitoxin (DNA-binding transcriptional repressor) of toxin-antitoxin stability system